jgi:hypothetical protein
VPEEAERRLQMYVRSRKAVTSFYRPPTPQSDSAAAAPMPVSAAGDRTEMGEETFFLSDDQARALALVEELAHRRGWAVDVKDVAKVGRLERMVTEHLRGVETFPVLIAPSGARLEGCEAFTEERLCEMMPAEMPVQRAFTYLKVKGGDLERIRHAMLAFPQVREVHLLAGDWDIFVVLEFAAESSPTKRKILEFVTTQIRGLPDVLDTSTFVPEHSVTKFPF